MAEAKFSKADLLALVAQVGVREASRQTGVPFGTLARWARQSGVPLPTRGPPRAPKGTAQGTSTAQGAVHVLPPPPRRELPEALRAQAEESIRVRLCRLAQPVVGYDESLMDSAKIVALMLDRFALFGDIDKAAAPAAEQPDPSTPEGEAALVAMAAALPPRVLEAARRRQASG